VIEIEMAEDDWEQLITDVMEEQPGDIVFDMQLQAMIRIASMKMTGEIFDWIADC